MAGSRNCIKEVEMRRLISLVVAVVGLSLAGSGVACGTVHKRACTWFAGVGPCQKAFSDITSYATTDSYGTPFSGPDPATGTKCADFTTSTTCVTTPQKTEYYITNPSPVDVAEKPKGE